VSKRQVWVDSTSYSQTEAKPRVPRSWTLGQDSFARITVHRMRGIEGWFVSCHALDLNQADLCSTELEDAKAEACGAVKKRLARLTTALVEMGAMEKPE